MTLDVKAIRHHAPILYYDQVDSTNTLAAEIGRAGCAPFTVVMAERQTAGRGRHGRAWRTFPYHSLAMSVIIPDAPPELPLVACLSLYTACRDLGVEGVAVKWPNDLMHGQRKLAGVLTESYPHASGQSRFYVLGCGINVTVPTEEAEIPDVAGMLEQAATRPLKREEVATAFLRHLHQDVTLLLQDGFAPFVPAYKAACATLGKRVVWREAGRDLQGTAMDVTAGGHMLLSTADGIVSCHSGEMIISYD